jgi:uncharacterized membrane protein required for colicin V production
MAFWIGILVGGIFAALAVKIGLYEMWALFFNIVISIYLAVFLRPIITDKVPVGGGAEHNTALAIIITAVVVFAILEGISYMFITSPFSISFPKILDTAGSGVLGLLAGFLVWSFINFLIGITPMGQDQNSFVKKIGLGAQPKQAATSYLTSWCNVVNTIASNRDSTVTSEQLVSGLLKSTEEKAKAKLAKKLKPVKVFVPPEPKKVEVTISERDKLGPPPEPEVEDI